MSHQSWLPLTEFANKYKVSISTLRRRIKTSEVEYSYHDGRYLIRDLPLNQHGRPPVESTARTVVAPPQSQAVPQVQNSVKGKQTSPERPLPAEVAPGAEALKVAEKNESTNHTEGQCTTSLQLVDELKKAYSQILQEKEEQIVQLKEEVTDLQTLVRVLESENDRLKFNARESAPIDSWLRGIDFEK